ncbi:MAG: hypothetical protein D8M54_01175 [Chloroflexi bacterium]|nr:hypothetical protein [Chloroflexota bacterium]
MFHQNVRYAPILLLEWGVGNLFNGDWEMRRLGRREFLWMRLAFLVNDTAVLDELSEQVLTAVTLDDITLPE